MKYSHFISFAVGASIGSFVTWYYVNEKYKKIAQEEIDSVKHVFATLNSEKEEGDSDIQQSATGRGRRATTAVYEDKPELNEYMKTVMKNKYTDYSRSSSDEDITDSDDEETEEPEFKDPYVISPDEYGEAFGYSTISLSYTSDKKVIDENYEIVENVDEIIGLESLNHFGDYEDDSVFVRNERLKVDYEILLDQRTYPDIIKSHPYLMGALDDDDGRY